MSDSPRLVSRISAAAERLKNFAFGSGSGAREGSLGERLGQSYAERPDGVLVWMLAETGSEIGPLPALAQELSSQIEAPVHCLATTVTDSALVPEVASGTIQQIAPNETSGSIERFLKHWEPDLCVVVDYQSRPKLMAAVVAKGIPIYQVFSSREQGGALQKYPEYLASCRTFLAASAAGANAFRHKQSETSTVKIEITGPLSDTVFALPCNQSDCDELSKLLAGRPVWLAARVSVQEAHLVEAAHRRAFKSAHRILLILVPRILEDAAAIGAELESQGWRVAFRSRQDEPEEETQIYIADTDGEMGLWYRLAPISFMGGSMSDGSQPADPFSAAALGSAVLHGPFTGVNPSRFHALASRGASVRINDADELGEAVVALLAPDKVASLAQSGWAATTESAHVVERLAEILRDEVFASGVLD